MLALACSQQPPDLYDGPVGLLAGAARLASLELWRVVSGVVLISTSHRCRRFACPGWNAIGVPTLGCRCKRLKNTVTTLTEHRDQGEGCYRDIDRRSSPISGCVAGFLRSDETLDFVPRISTQASDTDSLQ